MVDLAELFAPGAAWWHCMGVTGASVRCKQSGREAKSAVLHTLRTGFEVNAGNNRL